MEIQQTSAALHSAAKKWRRRIDAGRRLDADQIADAIIKALAPLVNQFTLRYLRPGAEEGDLIAAGNRAIVVALEKFNPNRSTVFLTYVHLGIERAVRHAARHARTLPEPPHLTETRLRVTALLEQHPDLTPEQLATLTGYTLRRINSVLALLDQPRRPVEMNENMGAVCQWQSQVDNGMILLESIKALPERYRDIIMRRFYLQQTCEEIAQVIGGCSRQNVHIMERRALAVLKARLTALLGEDAVTLLLKL